MVYKPPFKITNISSGYRKGTFIIVDTKGKEYPHGGLMKTPRRALNYLKKVTKKFGG